MEFLGKFVTYFVVSFFIVAAIMCCACIPSEKDKGQVLFDLAVAIIFCMIALSGVKHILNDDINSNSKQ